jgi:hypothetical protein
MTPFTADDGHIVPLRPYGLSELFTGAARVLIRAPRLPLASGVLAALFTIAMQLAAGPSNTSHRRSDGVLVTHSHLFGTLAGQASSFSTVFVQAVVAQVALSLTAATLPNERRIWTRAWRTLPLLIAIELVRVASFITLGLFVVGVFLYVQWSLAPYVLVVEDTSVGQALRRSAELVRGAWGRVLGLCLICFVVTQAPLWVIQFAFALDSFGHPASVPSWPEIVVAGIALVPLVAFGAAFMSLVYVDLRCRHDGLAWKLDAARRGPEREPFGPDGVYAPPPWRPTSRR